MKILHIVDSMNPEMGGVCQAVRTMATSLAAENIASVVISTDRCDALFLKNEHLNIVALGPAKNPWGYSEKLIPWLVDNMLQYEVIIIHGLWQYYSFATVKASKKVSRTNTNYQKKKSPRLYVMPHGMLDPYFQRAPDRKLKALRNWLYWKLIEKRTISETNGLLFTCHTEKKLAKEPFKPYLPKSEKIVGLGVERPPNQTEEMQTAFFGRCPDVKDKLYFLFLSRIHQKKGVDLLINAYTSLYQKHEGKCPKLVIAGPGLDTAYGKMILDLVNDNAMNSNIFFPGMLEDDSKWGAFYNCEAFVLPSHQENFGIAVVESLACGIPVIISNKINIHEEIVGAGAGIANNDTYEGTYKMLDTWMSLKKEKKLEMTKSTYSAFENNYSISKATENLVAAITPNSF